MAKLYISKTTSRSNFRRTIALDRVHIRIPEKPDLKQLGHILKNAGETILSYCERQQTTKHRSIYKMRNGKFPDSI